MKDTINVCVKNCLTREIERELGIERFKPVEVNLNSLKKKRMAGTTLWMVEIKNLTGKIEVPLNSLKISSSQQKEIILHNSRVKEKDFLPFLESKTSPFKLKK